MKLLIVDDAKLIHFMIKKILIARGLSNIEFEDAFDGNEAIWFAKKFEPDLILMDVVMPEKDGIEALKEIKKNHPDMKVVMVSSVGTEKKVAQSLKYGAFTFIQKPFNEDELYDLVSKSL
jgi:two-component system chemotaxis response regulator CheY